MARAPTSTTQAPPVSPSPPACCCNILRRLMPAHPYLGAARSGLTCNAAIRFLGTPRVLGRCPPPQPLREKVVCRQQTATTTVCPLLQASFRPPRLRQSRQPQAEGQRMLTHMHAPPPRPPRPPRPPSYRRPPAPTLLAPPPLPACQQVGTRQMHKQSLPLAGEVAKCLQH